MGYYTTYYAYGLPSFLVVVIALYLLFTGAELLCSFPKIQAKRLQLQTRERLSMSESSWRNQVRLFGRRLGLGCVLG